MKTKLSIACGILNIVLSAVSFINTLFMALCVLLAFALSFSLFFMIAIPLTMLFGMVFFASLATNVINMIAGIGTVASTVQGGKYSRAFCIASIIADGAFIPANTAFLFIGALSVFNEINWLGLLIFFIAASAIMLAAVSLVLNAINLSRSGKTADSQETKSEVNNV